MSKSESDATFSRGALGLLLPRRVVAQLAEYVEQTAVIARGEGDVDRPLEQLVEVIERTNAHNQINEFLYGNRGVVRILGRGPAARKFIADKLSAMLTQMAGAGEGTIVKKYLMGFDESVLFLAAGGLWSKPRAMLANVIQGKALIRQAETKSGEARYNSVKRLANLVLADLVPKYLKVLGYLEAARTQQAVVQEGKGDNLGALVKGLRKSLPLEAAALVPAHTHKLRNALTHGRFEFDYEKDEVQLVDVNWKQVVSTATLFAELRAVFEWQSELLGRVTTAGASHVTLQTYEKVEFELVRRGKFDSGSFAHALMKGPFEKGAAWWDAVSPDWRDTLEKLNRRPEATIELPAKDVSR